MYRVLASPFSTTSLAITPLGVAHTTLDKIHIDFAGPMEGKMSLVVTDAHYKWIELLPVTTSTVFTTIQQLRQLFSRFEHPQLIVSSSIVCFGREGMV